MSSKPPPIVVSSRDFERIDALLDEPARRDFPGAAALRGELSRAQIVEPDRIPGDVVTMNSTARVVDESSGEEYRLTLVYPRDVDGDPGKVSVLAPVGSAIHGLRVGQSIRWPMPGGSERVLRIAEILHQPEASGQLHR
jgi:regulator of nucleoside diphosphate kinase